MANVGPNIAATGQDWPNTGELWTNICQHMSSFDELLSISVGLCLNSPTESNTHMLLEQLLACGSASIGRLWISPVSPSSLHGETTSGKLHQGGLVPEPCPATLPPVPVSRRVSRWCHGRCLMAGVPAAAPMSRGCPGFLPAVAPPVVSVPVWPRPVSRRFPHRWCPGRCVPAPASIHVPAHVRFHVLIHVCVCVCDRLGGRRAQSGNRVSPCVGAHVTWSSLDPSS